MVRVLNRTKLERVVCCCPGERRVVIQLASLFDKRVTIFGLKGSREESSGSGRAQMWPSVEREAAKNARLSEEACCRLVRNITSRPTTSCRLAILLLKYLASLQEYLLQLATQAIVCRN